VRVGIECSVAVLLQSEQQLQFKKKSATIIEWQPKEAQETAPVVAPQATEVAAHTMIYFNLFHRIVLDHPRITPRSINTKEESSLMIILPLCLTSKSMILMEQEITRKIHCSWSMSLGLVLSPFRIYVPFL
jgi:hypothetical protein